MQLSVGTPVVSMLPGVARRVGETGTIEDVARIAETADRLGYHHLTCSEHIGVPADQAGRRGARYWDPLATFGYLAARTERIRLATAVLVLGYHHPLEIAKRYGTLDLVSGGRVVLGVGVGTLKEEFDLLGAPFDDRGQRGDDALRALRASLSQREPSVPRRVLRLRRTGRRPVRRPAARAPLGGRADAALAAAGGDPGRRVDALRRSRPQQAKEWLDQVELPADFTVGLGPTAPFDPIREPGATADALGELAAAGVTIASARFVHHSLATTWSSSRHSPPSTPASDRPPRRGAQAWTSTPSA